MSSCQLTAATLVFTSEIFFLVQIVDQCNKKGKQLSESRQSLFEFL